MHTVLTCFITWLKVLLKVLVLIIAILFHRVIGIGNTFFGLVLVLHIAILFTSIVNNPASACMSACLYVCLYLCLFLSVCLSVLVYLYVCLYLCLSVCLPLCVSVSVCMSVCLPLCLSVCLPLSVSVCLYIWLYQCVCLSVSVCLSVCFYLCLSVCISDCISVCLSPCLYRCVCLSVCMSASTSVCLSVCLCISVCLSPCLYRCVCLSVCMSASTSVCLSVCVPVCLYIWLYQCVCLSVSVCLYVCLCLCLSVCISDCISVCVCLRVCIGVSVCLYVCLYVCSFVICAVRWWPSRNVRWLLTCTSATSTTSPSTTNWRLKNGRTCPRTRNRSVQFSSAHIYFLSRLNLVVAWLVASVKWLCVKLAQYCDGWHLGIRPTQPGHPSVCRQYTGAALAANPRPVRTDLSCPACIASGNFILEFPSIHSPILTVAPPNLSSAGKFQNEITQADRQERSVEQTTSSAVHACVNVRIGEFMCDWNYPHNACWAGAVSLNGSPFSMLRVASPASSLFIYRSVRQYKYWR